MFEHVDYYPGDPILGLNDLYNKDTRAEKVNLAWAFITMKKAACHCWAQY